MPITIDDKLLKVEHDHDVRRTQGDTAIRFRETFDFSNCTAEFIMDKAMKTVVIERSKPLRDMDTTTFVKYASEGRHVVDAQTAGHKIVSVETLVAQTKAAIASLPKEAQDIIMADFNKVTK